MASCRQRAHDRMKAGRDEVHKLLAFLGKRIGELAVLGDGARGFHDGGLHELSLTKLNN